MSADEIIKQGAIDWYGPNHALASAGFGCYILKQLKAKGFAVVELPLVDGDLHDTLMEFFIFLNPGPSLPITTSEGGDVHRTAKDAREYASHLLLAAAAAERDSEER